MAANATSSETEFLPLVGFPQCPYPRAGELAALCWHAAGDEAAPVLLLVPALGTPAGAYRRLAEQFAQAGVHAGVLELRGVGRSPVRARRGLDWGYADLVDGEIAHAYALLRERQPQSRLFALGHSLGGHALLLHRAHRPDQCFDGLALVASGTPYWRNYAGIGKWMVRALGVAASASSGWLGYYPGDKLRFGGRQGARLMREWAYLLRHGRFDARLFDGDEWTTRLARGQSPLLGITVPGDDYTPEASLAHLLQLVGAPGVGERLRVDARPGHFGWLRDPQPVVLRVCEWMRAVPG